MSEVASRVELAKVVHIEDRPDPLELVINRGSRDGLQPGQRYLVFGYGPEVADPDTGESLGRIELVRGRAEVLHVQDSLATLRSVEQVPARRGKRVIRDFRPLSSMLGGQVVEEDWPAQEIAPFRNVVLGDLAKPI